MQSSDILTNDTDPWAPKQSTARLSGPELSCKGRCQRTEAYPLQESQIYNCTSNVEQCNFKSPLQRLIQSQPANFDPEWHAEPPMQDDAQ